LHWAADRGQLACVKALVAAGADIAYEDVHGDDALEIARFRGHSQTEQFLFEALRTQGRLDGRAAAKEVLTLIALLVQKYKYWRERRAAGAPSFFLVKQGA
jgi:hypothetical protein